MLLANFLDFKNSKTLLFCTELRKSLKNLTHSLINHFETVPNSKKLQTTTEMWLLKGFKDTDA